MRRACWALAAAAVLTGLGAGAWAAGGAAAPDDAAFWELARARADALRISTLFTAQDVSRHLAEASGRERAIAWCRRYGVTQVFIETFRDGYQAPREQLVAARDAFAAAGFLVSGCVTTTQVGKSSTNWRIIACYTDAPTRDRLAEIFRYTAGVFDEIMIDDFLFTDCACAECEAARGGGSWAAYRGDLMERVSREHIMAPARAVNPGVSIIIKYPQWYDLFHERGYDVVRQTALFPKIWVGTETRDPDSERWGRKAQYEAYFIMRWLGRIGGAKCGGGWFDPYGTAPATYREQARQTVLAGAANMLLFCYGSLLGSESAANPEALREEIPGLLELAQWVRARRPRGVLAVKPPNSPPGEGENYIFDFIGMLGIPLVPEPALDEAAPALLVTTHLRAAVGWQAKIAAAAERGAPLLATAAVETEMRAAVGPERDGQVRVLRWDGDPRGLMARPQAELDALRAPLLAPLGIRFSAPGAVALYLFDRDLYAVENFRAEPASVVLEGAAGAIAERRVFPPDADVTVDVEPGTGAWRIALPPRALVVLKTQ